jgi:alpha-glucoside transport system permease protein
MLPALVLVGGLLAWPILNTILLSFYRGSVVNPTAEYVGFGNYTRLLSRDPLFLRYDWPPWSAVFNSLLWVVFFTGSVVALGLLVAVLADRVKYEKLAKAVVFLPMVISFTAASVIFRLLYSTDPDIGVLNAMLSGLGAEPLAILGRPALANCALIVSGIWIWTGLSMTVLSAAYKSLPREVLEAASVDGASSWQTFWRVSVPMMMGPIIVVVVTMTINALKAIDLVLVMTQGGPRGSTRIVGFTVYWEIFNNARVGYGSAAAVILLLLVLPLMWIQLRRIRSQGSSP